MVGCHRVPAQVNITWLLQLLTHEGTSPLFKSLGSDVKKRTTVTIWRFMGSCK